MNLNRVTIAGRLCGDPGIRYTPKGTAVGNFRVAINRKWKKDGQDLEECAFVDVTCWAKQAEAIGEHFKKGSPILLEGRLKSEEWDDRETKQKRSKLIVVLENFYFVGGEKRAEASSAEAPPHKNVDSPIGDDVPF